MQRKIKNLLPILLFLLVFAAIMCGLPYFYLTEQPEPVSAPKINDALISQDLLPVDITDAAQGNFPGAGLTDCIVAEQGDLRFEFYTFDNPSSALRVYREARKLIITTKMETPRAEIEQGKANYKYYSLAAGGNFSVTAYVKNTAVYAYCAEENQSKIINVLDTIGYVDANRNRIFPRGRWRKCSWGYSPCPIHCHEAVGGLAWKAAKEIEKRTDT